MSRKISAVVLAGLAASGLAGCQQKAEPNPDTAADIAAIRAVEDEMRAAYRSKDAAKLVATYAPDATLYVTSGKARVGTQALSEGAAKDMDDPAFNVTFTTTKAAASGDIGYTQGSVNIRYTNPATGQGAGYQGYYLTVFARQPDGSWKAIEDISTPAAPAG